MPYVVSRCGEHLSPLWFYMYPSRTTMYIIACPILYITATIHSWSVEPVEWRSLVVKGYFPSDTVSLFRGEKSSSEFPTSLGVKEGRRHMLCPFGLIFQYDRANCVVQRDIYVHCDTFLWFPWMSKCLNVLSCWLSVECPILRARLPPCTSILWQRMSSEFPDYLFLSWIGLKSLLSSLSTESQGTTKSYIERF